MRKTKPTSGPAKRNEVLRNSRGRHPLLKVGTPHHTIWEIVLTTGNPNGGITTANLRNLTDAYHPQVLADLQKARLVTKAGKVGSSFLYISDPSGVGIIPQSVTVSVELYETEDGSLVTRTKLHGALDTGAKLRRYLTSKTFTIDVPGEFAHGVVNVTNAVSTDPEYDPIETWKLKKHHRDDNVIATATVVKPAPYNNSIIYRIDKKPGFEEKGCIDVTDYTIKE